jgi:hypothetical protein
MVDTLKAWINGTRDYNTGVQLYNIIGTDEGLKALFAQGHNLYRNFKLQEEIIAIHKKLKAKVKPVKTKIVAGTGDIVEAAAAAVSVITFDGKKIEAPVNPQLHEACLNEAKRVYKEAMNKRAVLFSMVPANNYEDPNRQDLILSRSPLALDVARLYIWASSLFDKADYVKKHGRLPHDEPADLDAEIARLQDYEIKPALDNARKAYNKLKDKEPTAERVALMQKHQLRIEKLEVRWRSLKPAK